MTTPNVDERVDELIARLRYDMTGDQMRPMMESDESSLRDVLRELVKDSTRVDWLARFRWLDGETRVNASDGLPAAMDWEWERDDDGDLRGAIDEAMGCAVKVEP